MTNKLVQARTIESFDAAWREFQEAYPGKAVDYLAADWIPCRHRWAAPWTSQHLNLSHTTLSCTLKIMNVFASTMKPTDTVKVLQQLIIFIQTRLLH